LNRIRSGGHFINIIVNCSVAIYNDLSSLVMVIAFVSANRRPRYCQSKAVMFQFMINQNKK